MKALQDRTDAKLRYAKIHLDELKAQGPPSGDDFDKAHQESFLFHLIGSRDAFLAELNHYYQGGLSPDVLSLGRIRDALKKNAIDSPEVRVLYELEQDGSSWFSRAKRMRDHSTHVQGVRRAYTLGGEFHQKVRLRDPKSDQLTEQHFIDEFASWLSETESLVCRLRESAIKNLGLSAD